MNFFRKIYLFGKLIKFSHSLFALPFAFITGFLAFQKSNFSTNEIILKIILIILCMVFARSASMGFNRVVDHKLDLLNPRTKNREIPSGQIHIHTIIFLITFCSLCFFICSYYLNQLSFALSIPLLMILFFYSFTKRFTFFCHYILGFAIGLAPLAAWIGILGEFSIIPTFWVLGLGFNIASFDILYSIQDYDFDKKSSLHSIPVKFGIQKSMIIACVTFSASFFSFLLAGIFSNNSILFFLGLIPICFFYIFQFRIVKKNNYSNYPPQFYQLQSFLGIYLFFIMIIDFYFTKL